MTLFTLIDYLNLLKNLHMNSKIYHNVDKDLKLPSNLIIGFLNFLDELKVAEGF